MKSFQQKIFWFLIFNSFLYQSVDTRFLIIQLKKKQKICDIYSHNNTGKKGKCFIAFLHSQVWWWVLYIVIKTYGRFIKPGVDTKGPEFIKSKEVVHT